MSFNLLLEIKSALVDGLDDMRLCSAAGLLVPPAVYISSLPPKRKDRVAGTPVQGEHFPFVVLRFTDGEDTEAEGSVLYVRLICGVYAPEEFEDGEMDVFLLISRIRRLLLTKRTFGSFSLEFPLTYQVGDDEERSQPHPFHLGAVATKWRGPHPEFLFNQGGELGG